ncbi:MAG: hypothetical protein ABIK09_01735 [Pseudomonadota bacterium]
MRSTLFGLLTVLTLAACGTETKHQPLPGPDTGDTVVADIADIAVDAGVDTTVDAGVDTAVDTAADADPDVLESLPLEPSDAYLARKAAYLEACSGNNGPDSGNGFYAQTCRVAAGETDYADDAFRAGLDKIQAREDTADFAMAAVLRLLYLNQETDVLPGDLRAELEDTAKGFKYWVDEPGKDEMCYWTENHQVLYHSSELLVGQLYPDHVFVNNGMTGTEHAAHARPMLLRWLDLRARFGFTEWHSNVYFNEDMPALLNLAEYAEDPEIRQRAVMVLDLMGYDMLNNYYKGLFATVHGRTYPNKLVEGGLKDSTTSGAWLQLGLAESWTSDSDFTASFMATSDSYFPPPLLEAVAAATRDRHEQKQADSWDVEEGPELGMTYTEDDDIIHWFGVSAPVHPLVINGTMAFVDKWDLWDGFLFGAIPENLMGLVKPLVGTPQLKQLAEELRVLSEGITLERMHTYTWRTPHYQLSGAQDYNPGGYGTQTHPWQATLSQKAYVFTTVPGNFGGVDVGATFGSDWTGGWLPRVTLSENLGVIQYHTEDVPLLGEYLDKGVSHAYFPVNDFDEVHMGTLHWAIGRLGDGWVALWCDQPLALSEAFPYELIAPQTDTTWVVELGSVEDGWTFGDFTAAVLAADIGVEDGVLTYDSPTRGLVQVGWEGPMTIDGAPADIGPYARFDNAQCHQERGDRTVRIEHDGQALILDFDTAERRLIDLP